MSRTIFASATALALLTGAPALAAKSQSAETAATANGAKQKAERKICRTFPSTESRMKAERLCLTREGWKKFDAQQ